MQPLHEMLLCNGWWQSRLSCTVSRVGLAFISYQLWCGHLCIWPHAWFGWSNLNFEPCCHLIFRAVHLIVDIRCKRALPGPPPRSKPQQTILAVSHQFPINLNTLISPQFKNWSLPNVLSSCTLTDSCVFPILYQAPLIENSTPVSQFEISAKREYCSVDSVSPEDSCDGTLMSESRWMCACVFWVWGSVLPFMVIAVAAYKNTQCLTLVYLHLCMLRACVKSRKNGEWQCVHVVCVLKSCLKVHSPVTALKLDVNKFDAYISNRMPLKWLVGCHSHAETSVT